MKHLGVLLASLVFVFHTASWASGQSKVKDERVIVIYKSKGAKIRSSLSKQKHKIKRDFQVIHGVAATLSAAEIEDLKKDKDVSRVVSDEIIYATLADSHIQVNADQVHANGQKGAGVNVCIIDTGVDSGHSSLPTAIKQKDFVNDDNDATDDNGHGTHVAGIILSRHAIEKSIAPSANLLVAKALGSTGSGYASDIIASLDWCVESGAKVINLSLGGRGHRGSCDSDPMAMAANNVTNLGVAVFAASGNDGYVNRISTPACGSKVVAVGAVDKNDGRTSYSNESSELDLVAPGSYITSCYLNEGFAALSGTSMATPHAVGAAALLLGADASLSPADLRSLLNQNAHDLGSSGYDNKYGHGRLDALAAYNALTPPEEPPPEEPPSEEPPSEEPPPVEPPPASEQVLFEDFQSGAFQNFSEKNEYDWRVRSPREENIPGYSSDNQVGHASRCSSSNGCILETTSTLNLSGYASATLSLWRFVDSSLDSGEYLRVEVSSDGGTNWNMLANWTHAQGDSDQWEEETFDLSPYVSSAFKLRFISKENRNNEHTQIDDVLIEGFFP